MRVNGIIDYGSVGGDRRVAETTVGRQPSGKSKPIPDGVLDAICRKMHECPMFRPNDTDADTMRDFCHVGDEDCACYRAIRPEITRAKAAASDPRPSTEPKKEEDTDDDD